MSEHACHISGGTSGYSRVDQNELLPATLERPGSVTGTCKEVPMAADGTRRVEAGN